MISLHNTLKDYQIWAADIHVIKRTTMQLLSEFTGRQKIRLVGVGVSRLRERDERQTLITDFSQLILIIYFEIFVGLSVKIIQ